MAYAYDRLEMGDPFMIEIWGIILFRVIVVGSWYLLFTTWTQNKTYKSSQGSIGSIKATAKGFNITVKNELSQQQRVELQNLIEKAIKKISK